jgi:hypothetical protein
MFARKCRPCGTALILFFAVAGMYGAENNLHRNVLSNRDVVTLAKAGFDEEFLVNIIVSSRSHFDTSADALAALAEQGVTQRIVEVMMNPEVAGSPAGAPAPATAKPVRASKVSPARLAIMENAPYYESKSVFFGLWKKKLGVGAPPPKESKSSHLGSLYAGAMVQQKYLPVGGQYAVAR